MSLQIVEKKSNGLSRGFSVTVPAGELNKRLTAKIAEIAPQMNVKGFRPGKVPAAHVKRVHGKALMAEVLEQALTETSKQVLDERGLRIASQPSLAPTSDLDEVMNGGVDLAYDIDVEVMPDFEPADLSKLKLTRPTYEVPEADVEEALAELAKQARFYEPRTGKTVKAKDEDQVIIDFVGKTDGVAFAGGSATDTPLVLGSKQFIPGFEEQLVGAKPGETKIVKVTFPADYQSTELAGKDAEFEVTIKEVKAPTDAKVDDELAKKLGLADLEALKTLMKDNLSQRYAQASAFKLKRALLDELDSKHDFELPPRMVEAEFGGIWEQVERDRAAGNLDEADAKKSEKKLREEYTKIAQRRVRLGLVLAEVGRRAGVTISDQELNQAMINEAQQYGAQAQQAYEAFRRDANLQNQLRAPIYEAKVVEHLLADAKITDKVVSREEMEADDDLPEQYGG